MTCTHCLFINLLLLLFFLPFYLFTCNHLFATFFKKQKYFKKKSVFDKHFRILLAILIPRCVVIMNHNVGLAMHVDYTPM